MIQAKAKERRAALVTWLAERGWSLGVTGGPPPVYVLTRDDCRIEFDRRGGHGACSFHVGSCSIGGRSFFGVRGLPYLGTTEPDDFARAAVEKFDRPAVLAEMRATLAQTVAYARGRLTGAESLLAVFDADHPEVHDANR